MLAHLVRKLLCAAGAPLKGLLRPSSFSAPVLNLVVLLRKHALQSSCVRLQGLHGRLPLGLAASELAQEAALLLEARLQGLGFCQAAHQGVLLLRISPQQILQLPLQALQTPQSWHQDENFLSQAAGSLEGNRLR